MPRILNIFLILISLSAYSQQKKYFHLENQKNGKSVKIKPSSYLTYYIINNDTINYFEGELLQINKDSILIDNYSEFLSINNTSIEYNKQVNYLSSTNKSIAKNDLLFINDNKNWKIKSSFGIISGIGLLSALIIAPLASIDKNSSDNFNVSRYKIIALTSLIVSGVSLIIYIPINGKRNLQIPKNI